MTTPVALMPRIVWVVSTVARPVPRRGEAAGVRAGKHAPAHQAAMGVVERVEASAQVGAAVEGVSGVLRQHQASFPGVGADRVRRRTVVPAVKGVPHHLAAHGSLLKSAAQVATVCHSCHERLANDEARDQGAW